MSSEYSLFTEGIIYDNNSHNIQSTLHHLPHTMSIKPKNVRELRDDFPSKKCPKTPKRTAFDTHFQ